MKVGLLIAVALLIASGWGETRVALGTDSVVRVSDDSGFVSSARLGFDQKVGRDWKLIARTGEGLRWIG